jgi:hypothetical protein
MYMMTQHPDMAQRVREEVLKTVGYARPTYEDVKNMKYLRAFINGLYLTICLQRFADKIPAGNRNFEIISTCVRTARFPFCYIDQHAPLSSARSTAGEGSRRHFDYSFHSRKSRLSELPIKTPSGRQRRQVPSLSLFQRRRSWWQLVSFVFQCANNTI